VVRSDDPKKSVKFTDSTPVYKVFCFHPWEGVRARSAQKGLRKQQAGGGKTGTENRAHQNSVNEGIEKTRSGMWRW
jgi:hypothetical protein